MIAFQCVDNDYNYPGNDDDDDKYDDDHNYPGNCVLHSTLHLALDGGRAHELLSQGNSRSIVVVMMSLHDQI